MESVQWILYTPEFIYTTTFTFLSILSYTELYSQYFIFRTNKFCPRLLLPWNWHGRPFSLIHLRTNTLLFIIMVITTRRIRNYATVVVQLKRKSYFCTMSLSILFISSPNLRIRIPFLFLLLQSTSSFLSWHPWLWQEKGRYKSDFSSEVTFSGNFCLAVKTNRDVMRSGERWTQEGQNVWHSFT